MNEIFIVAAIVVAIPVAGLLVLLIDLYAEND
jgi:hypothetical protein